MNADSTCARPGSARPHCICASVVQLGRITPHRSQLLTLITDYQTNGEIAEQLHIAPATVKREVEDLRDLTGCHSKRELARWWSVHRAVWHYQLRRS